MIKVKIYHKDYCPYCKAAFKQLNKLNWQYEAVEVSDDASLFNEMVTLSGRKTVPQIFINDAHIGGFDDFQNYLTQLSNLKRQA